MASHSGFYFLKGYSDFLKRFFDVDHFKVVIEFVTIFLLSYVLGFFGCKACEMLGFPGRSVVKNPPVDMGSIPGLGRSPGEGKGNPLQYPCLGNPIDR